MHRYGSQGRRATYGARVLVGGKPNPSRLDGWLPPVVSAQRLGRGAGAMAGQGECLVGAGGAGANPWRALVMFLGSQRFTAQAHRTAPSVSGGRGSVPDSPHACCFTINNSALAGRGASEPLPSAFDAKGACAPLSVYGARSVKHHARGGSPTKCAGRV